MKMKIKDVMWELERAKDSACLSEAMRESAWIASLIVAELVALYGTISDMSSDEIFAVLEKARHEKSLRAQG